MGRRLFHTLSIDLPQLAILLLLLLVATELSAQRQWEHLTEPFSGVVYPSIEIDEGVIAYAGGGRGVQISRDDGATWEQYGKNPLGAIPFGFVNGAVLAFAGIEGGVFQILERGDTLIRADVGLSGRVVWARTGPNDSSWVMTEEGLFISGDAGENWRKLPHDFGTVSGAQSFGLDDEQVMVVGNSRAWYSSDMGETFVSLNDRLPLAPTNGAILSSGALLIGTSNGFYRSTDRGKTFHYFALTGQLPLVYGHIGESASGELYTGTWGGKIYRISPDGLLVRRFPIPPRYIFGTRVLESGSVLLSDIGSGLWRMEGGGETFEQVGVPHATAPTEIKRGPNGAMLVQLNTGVARSYDDGTTWEYYYAVMEQSPGGYYEPMNAFHPLADGTILGFGTQGSVGRWRSGEEPEIFEDRLGTATGRAALQTESGALIVSDTGGGFRTTDGGLTWSTVDLRALSMAVAGDNSIWAAAVDLFVSRDDGVTFRAVTPPIDTADIIYRAPGGALYLIGHDGDREAHYLSTDNGAGWTEVELPCTGTMYVSIEDMGGKPGLGAITDCGVQYWDPEEGKWGRMIIALPDNERSFTSLYHSESALVAGGIGGLYRSPDVILSVESEGEDVEVEILDLSTR